MILQIFFDFSSDRFFLYFFFSVLTENRFFDDISIEKTDFFVPEPRTKKIAEIGRFLGEKSDFGGTGKYFGVEKWDGKKSGKNRDKSGIFRRFFGKGPIFADFSGYAVHVRRRHVRANIIFDKSAINSKYRCFFGVFRRFFGDFS